MSADRICRDCSWTAADAVLRLLGERVPESEHRVMHAECFHLTYEALLAALEQINREEQRLNPLRS